MQLMTQRPILLLILSLATTLAMCPGDLVAETPASQTLDRAFTTTQPWALSAESAAVRKCSTIHETWDLSRSKELSVTAQLVGDASGVIRLRWAIESRVGGTYCVTAPVVVSKSPTRVSVAFDPGSSELVPAGHVRPWDSIAAAQVTRIELRAECLFTNEHRDYAVSLSNVALTTATAPAASARVLDVALEPAPGSYRAAARMTFRIEPLPADPYSPDGDGDVRVILTSGRSVLAFLNQDYAAHADGSSARAAPLGRPYWCAYLPELPSGDVEIQSGSRRWKFQKIELGPRTPANQTAGNERTRLPFDIPMPGRSEISFTAPAAWQLNPGGKWDALEADPRELNPNGPATIWSPVLFWNERWGNYAGERAPNGVLASRVDAALAGAADAGRAQPLVILPGECLEPDASWAGGVFNWSGHPLRDVLNGPGELFRRPEGLESARRSMRYCIARWGLSKAVNALWLTSRLNAPGAPEFHQKIADALRSWTQGIALTGSGSGGGAIPIVSLHPFACTPKQICNISHLAVNQDFETYGWKPIGDAIGTKLDTGGLNKGKCYEIQCANAADTHLGAIDTFNSAREQFDAVAMDDFSSADTLAFEIRVPNNAPPDLRVGVHVRNRDSLWYETMLPGMLRPGDWTTCTLDITGANTNKLTPLSHRKDWNEFSRQRIREIGIHIYSTHPNWAPIANVPALPLSACLSGIRMIHVAPEHAARPPLITLCRPQGADLEPAVTELNVGDLWQSHVVLSKTFDNPFDPRQCDLCARITTPSGKVVVVPAFFDEVCERREAKPGGAEILDTPGGEFFTVRYRITESGPHQVTYELREGGAYKAGAAIAVGYEPLTFIPGTVTATLALDNPAFVVAPGAASTGRAYHGFVRASANKRNLQFDDGTFFYPIGADLRSPADMLFPYVDKKWTNAFSNGVAERGTYQYDDYFREFENAGMTWTRVWMCAYWCALEWRRDWPGYQGMGRYNLQNAWRMDHLLADAEKRGIEISLCLTNHGQYSAQVDAEWKYNPYNAQYGGPIKEAGDFYSNRDARIGHMNRLRYTVARFGHSPAIMTWSLFSEVEWTAGYKGALRWDNQPDRAVPIIDAWHGDMARFLKSIDPNKHMVATHFSHPWRGFGTLSVPEMEIASSNAYSSMMELGITRMDAAAALAAYWEGHDWFKGFKAYDKPALVEEQGRHWDGAKALPDYGVMQTREQLDADLHCGIWGCMVQPLAGSTGYWWWMHLHFDHRYGHYKALANYMAGEDFRPQDGEPMLEPAFRSIPSPNKTLLGRALKSDRRMYGWVYHDETPVAGETPVESGGILRVGGMKPGTYTLEFWNTYTGEKTATSEIEFKSVDGKTEPVVIELPPVDKDLAFKLKLKN